MSPDKGVPSKRESFPIQSEMSISDDDDTSTSSSSEDEVVNLPPVMIVNQRTMIQPENVPQKEIKVKEKRKKKLPLGPIDTTNARFFISNYQATPWPKYEHVIQWEPTDLCFHVGDKPVTRMLRVLNRSQKVIYVMFVRLYGRSVNIAHWWVEPKLRSFLAPGLKTNFFITVKADPNPLIPFANAGLELATAYKFDLVVGHFAIPIGVVYKNYIAPALPVEEEEIQDEEVKENEHKVEPTVHEHHHGK